MVWHPECYNKEKGTHERGTLAKFNSRCDARAACQFGGVIDASKGQRYVWVQRSSRATKSISQMVEEAKERGGGTIPEEPIMGDAVDRAMMDADIIEVRCIDADDTNGVLELGKVYTVDPSRPAGDANWCLVEQPGTISWSRKRFERLGHQLYVKCIDASNSGGSLVQDKLYSFDRASDNKTDFYVGGVAQSWSKKRFDVLVVKDDQAMKKTPTEGAATGDTTNIVPTTSEVAAKVISSAALDDLVRKQVAKMMAGAVQHEVPQALKQLINLDKLSDDVAMAVLSKIAEVTSTRVEVKQIDGTIKDTGVQHKQFPILLKAVMARINVWLAGPSGSGKTTAAMNVAKALNLEFRYTGAVGDQYALTGYKDANGKYVRTPFRDAWEYGGLFLWDEVDASDPNALLAFNAALANGTAPFPDAVIPKHKDCVLIAAANTYGHGATQEYVGRLKMDAAFLKRFAFLSWEYDEQLEMATAPNPEWTKRVQEIRKRVKDQGLRVLVTPRESYIGASLLSAGIPQSLVEEMTIKSGMTAEQWTALLNKTPIAQKPAATYNSGRRGY